MPWRDFALLYGAAALSAVPVALLLAHLMGK